MKKIIYVLILVASVFSSEKISAKFCVGYILIGSNTYQIPLNLNIDTAIGYGDTISIMLYYTGYNCTSCYRIGITSSPNLIQNGGNNVSCDFKVPGAGNYSAGFTTVDCDFDTVSFSVHLNVHYRTLSSVSDLNVKNNFLIYPANSSGIFNIQSKEEIREITLTDALGKVVFHTDHPNAEINLTNSTEGIYFYAIEDKKGGLYRGKILK